MSYDHSSIESKWQRKWQEQGLFRVENGAPEPRQYVLDMFPYPSGAGLHVGHPEGYTATDIYCRYLRAKGVSVLHPMGWDAFGLPAENYAIKAGTHPQESTAKNIATFKRQIQSLGFSYDWSREVNTSDPTYYRWTQWIFLQLYKMGLAYQQEAPANWCPSCQTVLANEQVVDGKCERCGTAVIQKRLKQWFFRVTKYAEELLSGLDQIDWPEHIKLMQRNWIGQSEGAELRFPLKEQFRFLLLHGYKGNVSEHWFPWLKAELEQHGHEVVMFDLPHADQPVVDEQVSYVLERFQPDEQTVIVGHSLGGVVAMKLLPKLAKPIRRLVLVATPATVEFLDKPRPAVLESCDWQFNFAAIKQNAREIAVVSDTQDFILSSEHGRRLSQALDAKLVEVAAPDRHFQCPESQVILSQAQPGIEVFTTRPDTLFGATYLVLAPEHELIKNYKLKIKNFGDVETYQVAAQGKTELQRTQLEKEKTGVELKGLNAVNPATGEEIPIWIADYVVGSYGTGAIMAVPAHDERDSEFANVNHLPVRHVVDPGADADVNSYFPLVSYRLREGDANPKLTSLRHDYEMVRKGEQRTFAYTGAGQLINSEEFNGISSEVGKLKITEKFGGVLITRYRLRDWLVSRQRYWGAPIPIIYCQKCGTVPVPEDQLPVLLPDDVDFRPTGESPLVRSKAFHRVSCPKCGASAPTGKSPLASPLEKGGAPAVRRESDTMDTFVCSSWYYLRYCDPRNSEQAFSPEALKVWLPVDTYMGGAEHAVLHLLYARFMHKALVDGGIIPAECGREPFQRLRNQGLILGPDGQKMSKSKGNVINPDEVVAQYGADTFRCYEMFLGPLTDVKPWNPESIVGVRRWLERVASIPPAPLEKGGGAGAASSAPTPNADLDRLLHQTIKKVTEDIEAFAFNTAIAQMMVFVNAISKSPHPSLLVRSELRTAGQPPLAKGGARPPLASPPSEGGALTRQQWETYLKLLAPFAPHLAEELWEQLGHQQSISLEPWPTYDPELVSSGTFTLVVQVDGKVRDRLEAQPGIDATGAEELARGSEAVRRHLGEGHFTVKFVPNRLINLVTSDR